jgi:hypothetical protein
VIEVPDTAVVPCEGPVGTETETAGPLIDREIGLFALFAATVAETGLVVGTGSGAIARV